MLFQAAEDTFREGIRALEYKKHLEAQALFEAAVAINRRLSEGEAEARYLSFYGLCLAVYSHRHHEGIDFCRQATAKESYNADLYLNLGRALLAAGRRKEAFASFCRGLRLQPGHDPIVDAMTRMGQRRRPVIPFLERANPLNVALGKLITNFR